VTSTQLEELLKLPADERLKVIERLWDSLSPDSIPIPDEHLAELERRLNDPDPGPGLTPEELSKHLKQR
jgi:putative addiction module component (TIGR02574 family)